jgi:hypothetical protein
MTKLYSRPELEHQSADRDRCFGQSGRRPHPPFADDAKPSLRRPAPDPLRIPQRAVPRADLA